MRQHKGDQFKVIAVDIETTLAANELDNPACGGAALFWRPFGPSSFRWALHKPAPRSTDILPHRAAE